MKERNIEEHVSTALYQFISKYGTEGLLAALQNYDSLHQTYICKNQKENEKI